LATALAVVSIAISLVALGTSLATLRFRRSQARRELFFKMHERLVEPDLQKGRRLLAEKVDSVEAARTLRAQAPDDYALVSRSLAMFDIVALYARNEFLDERLLLEEWGHTLAKAWEHGRFVIAERAQREPDRWSAWQNLQRLGARACVWAEENPRGIELVAGTLHGVRGPRLD
jgi:hypothetical protein